MLDVLKNHGEIRALAFEPVKDRALRDRDAVLERIESQLAAVILRLSLSSTTY
jgi:hypothetical protein